MYILEWCIRYKHSQTCQEVEKRRAIFLNACKTNPFLKFSGYPKSPECTEDCRNECIKEVGHEFVVDRFEAREMYKSLKRYLKSNYNPKYSVEISLNFVRETEEYVCYK